MRLAFQKHYPMRLCLFVDGLDEYEGDETEIARLFSHISESPNVKCCVSSRPHQPFIDAFKSSPTLRVHDFTKPDIQLFVSDKLKDDIRWSGLEQAAPRQAIELRRDIVDSAKGVFLWVKLVVHSLLRGLGNHDGVHDLQARLLHVPKELEGLYERMIFRVENIYKEDSSRIFRLVHAATDVNGPLTELTLLQLAIAVDTGVDIALTATPDYFTQQQIDERSRNIAVRVLSRCGGLLEIQRQVSMEEASPGLELSYLHRTVKEYLQTHEAQRTLKQWTSDTRGIFNPLSSVYVAYIVNLNLLLNDNTHISPEHAPEDIARNALKCLYYLQFESYISREKFVLICDRAFAVVERLSRVKEDVRRAFPPRSPRQVLAISFRLYRYLEYLLEQSRPSKAIHTWLELAVATQSLVDTNDHNDQTIPALIKHGADINAAWTRWLQLHSLREMEAGHGPSEMKAKLELFLLHGATVEEKDLFALAERLPEEMQMQILEDVHIRARVRRSTKPGSSISPLQVKSEVKRNHVLENLECLDTLESYSVSAGGCSLTRAEQKKSRKRGLMNWAKGVLKFQGK